MKKILVWLVAITIPVLVIAQTMTSIGQWVVINSSTATPAVLTNAVIKAKRVTFVGNKATRTANTGTVYIGQQSDNDTQPIEVQSGQTVSLLIPENQQIDLSKLYLDVVTANDGVLVLYE